MGTSHHRLISYSGFIPIIICLPFFIHLLIVCPIFWIGYSIFFFPIFIISILSSLFNKKKVIYSELLYYNPISLLLYLIYQFILTTLDLILAYTNLRCYSNTSKLLSVGDIVEPSGFWLLRLKFRRFFTKILNDRWFGDVRIDSFGLNGPKFEVESIQTN